MKCENCRHHGKGHECFPAARGTRCRGATEQLQAENESHLRNIALRAEHVKKLQAELDEVKKTISQTLTTLKHGLVFISSRQKMHKTGRSQYEDNIKLLEQALRPEQEETCWLCGGKEPDETIKVGCETPGGKPCKEKEVRVHNGCYMDIQP